MTNTRTVAIATLVVVGALAAHAPEAQGPGLERRDLMKHDLSAPGREVVRTLATYIVEKGKPLLVPAQ
jgi:hypothetical protein